MDEPELVKVNEIYGTQITVLELSVDRSDVGKAIGKKENRNGHADFT